MKLKDVAKRYGLNSAMFATWIKASGYPHKAGAMGGLDIPDDVVEEAVEAFKSQMEQQHQQAAADAAEQERLAQERQAALANMIITSGFTFDGYTITKYSGYISGDHAVEIARGTEGLFGGGVTSVSQALMGSLVDLRRQALLELKESAYVLGCNAIIGVDFDYITLQPETSNYKGEIKHLPYVFGVTANGNAVVIEPDKRTALG